MSERARARAARYNEEADAALAFRESVVDRADMHQPSGYPLWYGWVIVEAFRAGAQWQRLRTEPKD